MMGLHFVLSCAVLLTIGFQHSAAMTDEERAKIFTDFLPYLTECSKEFSVTEEQIKADGKAGKLNNCLIKCILRKIEVIDEKGLFNADKAIELSKQHILNAEEQKTIQDIIVKCSAVNEQTASDGEEGCDRARMLVECALPYKSQFAPEA